ncbi:hypothetical protein [Streptomyces spiralis]
MSPFLFDADLATITDLAARRRERTTVIDAMADHAASVIADYAAARAAGQTDLAALIRDHAEAIDPQLVAELDGFDYPAAA